jgi:type II secretory pathway component GspD/PulD (secretin)
MNFARTNMIAAVLFVTASANAQGTAAPSPLLPVRTWHLKYATSQNEQNELLTALRNIGPSNVRIFLIPSHGDVTVAGTEEQLSLVGELITRLDHPNKLYRLTYTFTESDSGKRIGLQRYSMTLVPGQRMQMKQGSRVPLITGSINDVGKASEQRSYIDIGLNFDSQVEEYGDGVRLKSRVEQSSIADEKSGLGSEDPIIRQTYIEGTTTLIVGKPVSLGALDLNGSTRHVEVEALIEIAK